MKFIPLILIFLKSIYKHTFVILFLLPAFSFAQDSRNWIYSIDTIHYKVLYKKKNIPKELYPILKIKSTKQIANPNEPVDLSCNRKDIPNSRFNWIACDKKNHWIVSITNGGIQILTRYVFIDKSNGKLNDYEIKFSGPDKSRVMTLKELILKMKSSSE
jgi:hypothetical protein